VIEILPVLSAVTVVAQVSLAAIVKLLLVPVKVILLPALTVTPLLATAPTPLAEILVEVPFVTMSELTTLIAVSVVILPISS
jgi:hypothetical protein